MHKVLYLHSYAFECLIRNKDTRMHTCVWHFNTLTSTCIIVCSDFCGDYCILVESFNLTPLYSLMQSAILLCLYCTKVKAFEIRNCICLLTYSSATFNKICRAYICIIYCAKISIICCANVSIVCCVGIICYVVCFVC